jgi:predicted permease
MSAFLRDLRYAVRSFARSPVPTAGLILTIAVGVGAYAGVTGFTNGLLTSTIGVPDSRGLFTIDWHAGADRHLPIPYAMSTRLLASMSPAARIAAFRESRVNVVVGTGTGDWMPAIEATPEIWDVVSVRPSLGRLSFDTPPNAGFIPIVIAYDAWQHEFDGHPNVIGTRLTVDGRPGRVVGVMPESVDGLYVGRAVDLWLPLAAGEHAPAVGVIARVPRAESMRAVQAQVGAITGAEPGGGVMAYTGIEPEASAAFERLRIVLSWAALVVLLTAAANVAGFLLSRASRRSHETAARVALGATRGRLAAHIAADSVVISAGGGLLAVAVAYWTVSAIPALLYVEDAARLRLAPDIAQIAATAATYTAIMLVCALAPLADLHRHGPMDVLRRSGTSITPGGWLRSALVVAQMTACVVLVTGAALLFAGVRTALESVREVHIGQPIVATLMAAARYANEADGRDYFRRAGQAALQVPRIGSVASVGTLPGGRAFDAPVRLEPAPSGWRIATIAAATPSGRDLLHLTLVRGRTFGGADGPGSCRVALVNEAVAAKYFGGDAVGRAFRDSANRRVDIVGIVAEPADQSDPVVYFYDRQAAGGVSAEQDQTFRLPILADPGEQRTDVDVNIASPNYFETVGATLTAGRRFDETAPCDAAIVNRQAAQRYFNGHAVGGAVVEGDGRRAEIVGVVDEGVLDVLQRRPEPTVYFPASQRYMSGMVLIAETPVATPETVANLTRALRDVPGALQPPTVETLEDHLSHTALGPERIAAVLVGVSAVIALALGLLGVYGVMSDAVLQRKPEIALRLALGARSWTIVGHVVRDGARIAATGAIGGLIAASIVVAVARRAMPGLAAPPIWIWAAGPVMLAVMVAAASVLPSRWALAVDPLTLTRDQ